MRTAAIVLTVAAFVLASFPTAQADPEVDCHAAIAATKAEWDTHPDGLPVEVAASGFQAVFQACYVPAAPEPAAPEGVAPEPARAPLLDFHENAYPVCAGEGTDLSWNDDIMLAGHPYPVLETVAKGKAAKFALPIEDPKYFMHEGAVASPLDEMTVVIKNKLSADPGVDSTWLFAKVPMGAKVNLSGWCYFALMTESSWFAQGSPLGSAVINLGGPPILEVRVRGFLCTLGC